MVQKFQSFKEESNKHFTIKLCSSFSIQVFHLFEESLLEVKKTQLAFQSKILRFIQKNGISKLVKGFTPHLNRDSSYLLILSMFLSNKVIDDWLPTIIKCQREELSTNTSIPKSSNHINLHIDSEVNILVGRALVIRIKN